MPTTPEVALSDDTKTYIRAASTRILAAQRDLIAEELDKRRHPDALWLIYLAHLNAELARR